MKLPALGYKIKQRIALVSTAIAILFLVLLASSVGGIEMSPGKRLIFPEQEAPELIDGPMQFSTLWIQILIIVVILLTFIVFFVVFSSKESRKRALQRTGAYLLLIGIFQLIYWLSSKMQSDDSPPPATGTPVSGPIVPIPPILLNTAEPVTISPTVVSPWTSYLVTLLILTAVTIIAVWIWWIFRQPASEFEQITRAALFNLSSGRKWEDVIIQCYADMSAAASRRANLNRPGAMTPSEFVVRLEEAGLPSGPVRSLTRLFEQARYGRHRSSSAEVQQAVDALTDILRSLEKRS